MTERKPGNESLPYKCAYIGFYMLGSIVVASEVVQALGMAGSGEPAEWDSLGEVSAYYSQHDASFTGPDVTYTQDAAIASFQSPKVFAGRPTEIQFSCTATTLYAITISQDNKYAFGLDNPVCSDGVITPTDQLVYRGDLPVWVSAP
jgi:hypothetical protein